MPKKEWSRACRGNAAHKKTRARVTDIITEYHKGTRWAAYAFCAMFAFLLLGVVMWGW